MNKLMIALAVTAPAAGGQEVSPPPAAVLQLEPYRKTVALRAKAGGHEGLFVFDTAGGISQLSLAFAERIGCKPWGRITGFQIMGQRLDMAQCGDVKVEMSGQAWRLPVVGVFDLMSLFSEREHKRPTDLFALDLFAKEAITIDFPRRLPVVESEGSLRVRAVRATEFPVRMSREVQGRALAVSIGVPTARGHVWMELDSGNGGTILVSKQSTSLFGLDSPRTGRRPPPFIWVAAFR